ncbi:MAG TPA: hypothetical protein VK213_10145 [Bacteroidales bacterium]|nr:hypothetical protein [Bacteroidales bacterium]
MKTLFTSLAVAMLTMSTVAQIDHDYNANDRVPVVNTTITKDQVPQAVLASVNKQFNKDNPVTWSKFPYALKEYGWVYDVGASEIPLDRYEVIMRTTNGNELWAVYSAAGDLIETREVMKDVAVPKYVLDALNNSKYSGWQIVGNKEIIRYYHDHDLGKVEQHFRLTVEKDGDRKSLSFNYQSGKDKS